MNVKKYVRALLCLYLTLIIAMDAVKAQTLKVGDNLPPELWSMPLQVINHPTGKEILTLSEYKDKLIILDFWATWCAPCIKSLTKLDTLQREFGEQLAVVPITYENADKVLPFLTKRGYQLPSVINDSTLKKYFPHRSIPHQVWVRAGEVLAVTGAEYATRENMINAIRGEEVKTEEAEANLSVKHYYNSGISSYQQDKGVRTKISKEEIYMFNQSLGSIYVKLYKDIIHWSGRFNRVISEVPDSLLFKVFQPSDYLVGRSHPENIPYSKWKLKNAYCYLLQMPDSQSLQQTLRVASTNLNHYSADLLGIYAGIEKRKVNCLAVIDLEPERIRVSDHLPSIYQFDEINLNRFTFQNIHFSHFFGVFREQNWTQQFPILDLTGYEGKITATFNSKLTDRDAVKLVLREHGFDLVEREMELDMLVISPLKSKN